MDRGLVFNIQKYCLHDGPGIRTTVFLKGCPLRCDWCHNPESQPREADVRVLEARCVRCGACLEACPQGGRPEDRDRFHLATGPEANAGGCSRCEACVAACPTGARDLIGREMTVEQVVEEVLRDQIFHDQSGGGVTLSGGEPLSQAPFALRLLQAFRERMIHTAIDTCGFVAPSVLREVAAWVDLFLFDVKTMDDTSHRARTGVSNGLILENLKTLGAIHANIWIRIPLIPGFNMDDDQLDATARFVATIPGVRQVHLLPYHSLGAHKLSPRAGDRPPPARRGLERAEPSASQIEHAAQRMRAVGLRTLIGG